jgi:hypothetical protein
VVHREGDEVILIGGMFLDGLCWGDVVLYCVSETWCTNDLQTVGGAIATVRGG